MNKATLWYVAQCSPSSLGKKKKKELEKATNYSVTFCNVNFAYTLVGINSMNWTIKAIECKDVL